MAVTRTIGPLHFEDLDPHRFEDLVRELVYDFKDWQSIEATGRGGADEGFDIRAFERVSVSERVAEEEEPDENEDVLHPMEGNLWMFQCKRETEVGPTKVAKIINDGVTADSPPYGYVLAAPAGFSKKSFDVFRDELRNRGVMEFYLWGRAALEDMLHLPKNDRILFTFFGISLVTRRRSRATEIRVVVARKNKLMRTLGDDPHHKRVLVRDTADSHYPYSSKYDDFERHPRWRAYYTAGLDPRGLIVSVAEHFAYWDRAKGEWDMAEAFNLDNASNGERDPEERRAQHDLRDRVESFWRFFPRDRRVMYVRNGLIRFEDLLVIDEKGDSLFDYPHLYVEFTRDRGPFFGFAEYLRIHEHRRERLDELTRTERFPKAFDAPRIGTVHSTSLKVSEGARRVVSTFNDTLHTLYDVEGRLDFLQEADVIPVEGTVDQVDGKKGQILIQITHKGVVSGKDFLDSLVEDPTLKHRVQDQIGREVTESDRLHMVEFKLTYGWAIERARASSSAC